MFHSPFFFGCKCCHYAYCYPLHYKNKCFIKVMFNLYSQPLVTNLAFNLSIFPMFPILVLKTHLVVIGGFSLSKSTSIHVLFSHIDFISSSMASFHPLWCNVFNTLNDFLTSNGLVAGKIRWSFNLIKDLLSCCR